MSKYDALYFVGDNQAINRVRVDSSKTRNRGAFSGSLAALVQRDQHLNSSHYLYTVHTAPVLGVYVTLTRLHTLSGFIK